MCPPEQRSGLQEELSYRPKTNNEVFLVMIESSFPTRAVNSKLRHHSAQTHRKSWVKIRVPTSTGAVRPHFSQPLLLVLHWCSPQSPHNAIVHVNELFLSLNKAELPGEKWYLPLLYARLSSAQQPSFQAGQDMGSCRFVSDASGKQSHKGTATVTKVLCGGVFYCENSNIFTEENDFMSAEVLYGQDVPEERARKGLQEQLKLESMESEGKITQLSPHRTGVGQAQLRFLWEKWR